MIKRIRLIFFVGILIWTIGILSPCLNMRNPVLLIFTDQIYSAVCHQNPDKTFLCGSNFLFVCARCFGIYTGALACSFIILFYKKWFRLNLIPLIISAVPLLLDVLFISFHIYAYTHIVSFFTGMLFGSISFIYILSVIENSYSELVKGK